MAFITKLFTGRTDNFFFSHDLVTTIPNILDNEFSSNHYRKDWTLSEMVEIKRAIEPYEIKKAEQRKDKGQKSGGRGKKKDKLCEESAPSLDKTRDIVAGFVGISHDTLKKAEKIVEAAEQQPEKYPKRNIV
jgi:hypothetical protein